MDNLGNFQSVIEDSIFQSKDLLGLINNPQKIDGLVLLGRLTKGSIPCAFFDPQYRGILDYQKYGNEGKNREKKRCSLEQMDEKKIIIFIKEINRVLQPSGHLFLWIDKFHLCEGFKSWVTKTDLQSVDLVVWEKTRIGMGYRTRNKAEFLVVLQKKPLKAKNVWRIKNIPNVIEEEADKTLHPHAKPVDLQKRLIEAVTNEGEVVLDVAMGGGSVYKACKQSNRDFIGGDINGFNEEC